MKKVWKWSLIAFFGLGAMGMVIEAAKSPEQKMAEAAEREAQKAQREQENQLAKQERAAAKAAEQAAEEEAARQAIDALPSYSASELARAYDANTVAADQKFKGQTFKVTGTITDINTDIMGNPYVSMRGGVNQFLEPQFAFDKDSANQLAELSKGMKVTLMCTGKGDIAKTPMSDDCIIL